MKKLPGFTQDYLLSKATTLPDKTRLERAVEPLCARHPGECGILALDNSLDAFAARYRLTEMAARTLDVQYYIWEDDMSGRLLFSVLLSAAKRGVHVRLLLDDNNTPGLDDTLRLLDSHPNIEVRLFNPFSFRTLRALGYLTDFARLNRRMHNKKLHCRRRSDAGRWAQHRRCLFRRWRGAAIFRSGRDGHWPGGQ